MLAFVGLHWPFWPLWPWMIFLSKKWPLLIKIKHNWHVSNNQMSKPIAKRVSPTWITVSYYACPPVYLHSIFEILSVTRIFFNFKISSLKNWKINLISKLIFAGYTGSRNQVQTRKKIKLVLNSIFFQVWNKLRNPKFENRVQRDRA